MPKRKPVDPVKPVSEVHEIATTPARSRPVIDPTKGGLGGNAYSDTTMHSWFTEPLGKKQEKGRDTWANTALVLALRAKRAAQTYSKKDFNSLYRLVLSAGIAFDKAFPQVQAPAATNLVFQLFGSLGRDTTIKILEPARPIIDVTPQASQEIPSEPPLGGELSGQHVGSSTSPVGPQTPVGYIPSGEPLDDTK